jgi:hypothetical protein
VIAEYRFWPRKTIMAPLWKKVTTSSHLYDKPLPTVVSKTNIKGNMGKRNRKTDLFIV